MHRLQMPEANQITGNEIWLTKCNIAWKFSDVSSIENIYTQFFGFNQVKIMAKFWRQFNFMSDYIYIYGSILKYKYRCDLNLLKC